MCKFLIALSLLFSVNVCLADANSEVVAKHFIVNADEEQSVQSFLNEDLFSQCENTDVTLSLQYAFSEVRLQSTQTYDGKCAVLLVTETEMGDESERFCALDIVAATDWTRDDNDVILLTPPKCDEKVLELNANADSNVNVVEAKSKDVDVMKNFFAYLISIFIGMLAVN